MNAESRPRSASERRIYVAAAIATTALILIGFARTYYLKFLYGAPPLTPLVHLHGLGMSVWFGLFFVQVFLVSKRRVDLHRTLGTFGMLWAPVVFVVATATSITAAKLGHAPPGPPPLVFLAVPLGDMFFFACVVPLAFVYRSQPAVHKRLMLLAFLLRPTRGRLEFLGRDPWAAGDASPHSATTGTAARNSIPVGASP